MSELVTLIAAGRIRKLEAQVEVWRRRAREEAARADRFEDMLDETARVIGTDFDLRQDVTNRKWCEECDIAAYGPGRAHRFWPEEGLTFRCAAGGPETTHVCPEHCHVAEVGTTTACPCSPDERKRCANRSGSDMDGDNG
jgi:hypothetical protein